MQLNGSRGTGGCPEPAPQPTPASTPAPSGPDVGTDLQGKPKRMPNYDGKSSWSDYLVQFEIAAEMNRWSPKQKAMELATSLVGQARGVLSDLSSSERTDFSALVRKLTLRFEPVDLVGMYQSQLRSRRQKRNESIPELVQEISKLTIKAFPSADEETRNYMSVTSFITALSNEQQELFVYQRDPKRIEEAGKAAMAFESFQADRQQHSTQYVRMQKETNQSSTPLGGFTDLAGRIARIEQSQANVQPTRPVTAGNAKDRGNAITVVYQGIGSETASRGNEMQLKRPLKVLLLMVWNHLWSHLVLHLPLYRETLSSCHCGPSACSCD